MVWDPILSERGWSRFPDNIGLGFRVRGEGIGPGPFGMLNSPGTFGHMGAGSTGFWIDPEYELSYALLTTGLPDESHHLESTAMLSDLIIRAHTIKAKSPTEFRQTCLPLREITRLAVGVEEQERVFRAWPRAKQDN